MAYELWPGVDPTLAYDVWFENSRDQVRVVASIEADPDRSFGQLRSMANQEIDWFLDRHNYKSYYTRNWVEDGVRMMYDVGSHTEFFFLMPKKEAYRCESGFYQPGQQ